MKEHAIVKRPLSLTNSGELSLFFVGVGSAFSKQHFQNNLLIIKGPDHLLVDCGTRASKALQELGISVPEIGNVVITHSHADHIGGVEELMLVGRYVARKKPTIYITPTLERVLWDLSLRGGTAYNEGKGRRALKFDDFWNIVRPRRLRGLPRETFSIDIGSINIKLFRTMHFPERAASWRQSFWSCGLIIDDRVMFTSDTRYDPGLLESFTSIFSIDAIFHDCQFFTGGIHAGIEELTELPESLRSRMCLMHYGDSWEEHSDEIDRFGLGRAKQWRFYDFP